MPKIIDQLELQILSHAKEIIKTEGYEHLNMRRVANKCGIALGTIYNYFQTKECLLEELMSRHWEEFFSSLDCLENQGGLNQKLKFIYEQLQIFLRSFHQEWVNKAMFKEPDFCQKGMVERKNFIEKLILKVEQILLESRELNSEQDVYQIAGFIVANYLAMLQMKRYDFQFFELVLTKILQ